MWELCLSHWSNKQCGPIADYISTSHQKQDYLQYVQRSGSEDRSSNYRENMGLIDWLGTHEHQFGEKIAEQQTIKLKYKWQITKIILTSIEKTSSSQIHRGLLKKRERNGKTPQDMKKKNFFEKFLRKQMYRQHTNGSSSLKTKSI